MTDRISAKPVRALRVIAGVAFTIALALTSDPLGYADVPQPSTAQFEPEQSLLRELGIPTDGPGLLGYLKTLCGNDEDLGQIEGLIRQLGSASSAERIHATQKLVALGAAAVPALRRAVMDSDLEVAHRAKKSLQVVYGHATASAALPAIRLLGRLRPEGLAQGLVRFLPYTNDEDVEEEIWFTVYSTVKTDRGLLSLMQKSLDDTSPARRALAACVLGRLGTKEQQAAVQKTLADPDPHVRLRAAQGLLAGKSQAGVPVLIKLLQEPAVEVCWQAEELLHWIARDAAPEQKIGAGTFKERGACQGAWEAWWQHQVDKLDFLEIERDHRRPGLLLVSEREWFPRHSGHVWLCGCDGKRRWQLKVDSVDDARLLPGNRLLIFAPSDREASVIERDLHGKTLWKPNVMVSEIAPGDRVVWRKPGQIGLWFARRMPNGNTALGLDSMGAMEITPGGKVVHRIQTSSVKPAQGLVILENDGRNNNLWEYGLRDSRPPVVRLRNGNTLMTYSKNGAERIEEVTASYKVVWDVITLREPPRRYRLRVCLGLLRLGFDQPRPANLDLNSLAHRLERLTDRDPEMRRVAAYDLAELGPR
jgi:hypothetical protein